LSGQACRFRAGLGAVATVHVDAQALNVSNELLLFSLRV